MVCFMYSLDVVQPAIRSAGLYADNDPNTIGYHWMLLWASKKGNEMSGIEIGCLV